MIFFFDAKKEPKKHLGGCESPQTPERFMVNFIYLSGYFLSILIDFIFILTNLMNVNNKLTFF